MTIINTQELIHRNLMKEIETIKQTNALAKDTKGFLCFLYLASSAKRKFKTEAQKDIKKLNLHNLEILYGLAVAKKLKELPETSYPTKYENTLRSRLNRFTRLKIIPSFHAGIFCADLFIPSLMLVIEVDGDIHLNELKMKKDTAKEKYLMKYGISVGRCSNNEINRFSSTFLTFLLKYKPAPYKRVKKALSLIKIDTIARYLTDEELIEFFGSATPIAYSEYLKWNCRRKELKKHSKELNNISISSFTSKYSGNESSVISSKEELWKN